MKKIISKRDIEKVEVCIKDEKSGIMNIHYYYFY